MIDSEMDGTGRDASASADKPKGRPQVKAMLGDLECSTAGNKGCSICDLKPQYRQGSYILMTCQRHGNKRRQWHEQAGSGCTVCPEYDHENES